MNRLLNKLKFFVLLALLPFVVGCGVETAIGLGLLGTGVPIYYLGGTPDAEGMLKVSLEKAEEMAMVTAEEMEIKIKDKKQKRPGEVLFVGESLRHKKVYIYLFSFSRNLTKVQIKARKRKFPVFDGRDHTYATTVLSRISEKCGGGVFIGSGNYTDA